MADQIAPQPETLTLEKFYEIAWIDFIHWAIGFDELREEFEKATGHFDMPPPKNAIEMMIDEACEVKEKYLKAFVVWVTENCWGIDEAPKDLFEKFKGRMEALERK